MISKRDKYVIYKFCHRASRHVGAAGIRIRDLARTVERR